MSNQSVETVTAKTDKLKLSLSIVAAIAGVVGFYLLSSQSGLVRAGGLVLGLLLALALFWTSTQGKDFIGFAKDSVRETKKVVWPTRKEATQITGIVFGFVLIMAIFLWSTDKFLEFLLYDLILGWKK
jgi:preprotein translocase subunit SecE